jgi:hypothetical protein
MTTRILSCLVLLAAGCVDVSQEEVGTTGEEVLVTWTNLVGVSASGNDLTKTASTSGWNAGAVSVETLAGDGFMEFAVADATTAKAAGLSSGDSNQSYTDIDYGLRLNANGIVYVWEAGVLRGNFGSYLAGDTFRVEVADGVVSYSRNGGTPFYTSSVPPSFPLLVDTAFSTPGATLTDVALVEPADACPAYDGTGLVCSGSWTVNNSVDLAEIADCANITGNLTIEAPGMSEIALPLLERIGGNLRVTGNTDMRRLRLPALKEIGGTTFLEALAATGGVDLSHLRTAGRLDTRMFGSLEANVPCLDTSGNLDAREWDGNNLVSAPIHVPRLRQVAGSIDVGVIVAPVLTTVDGDVSPNASLDAASLVDIGGSLTYGSGHQLPALTTVGDLRLFGPMPELPSLVRIRRTLVAGSATAFCADMDGTVTLELPSLERVGTLHICWNDVQQVLLPQLQTATSFFIRSAGITEPVTLPSMTLVKGKLVAYAPLDVPSLSEIRGGLDMFAPIDAPVLATVGARANFGVTGASISLPALTSAGGIKCCGLTTSLDLPALTQVGAFGGSGQIDVTGYATSISMPLLESTTGDFSIVRTYRLTTIDFSSLASVGPQLLINRNRELPDCYATNLFDQLVASGWSGTASIYGNNGTGTCP